MITQYGVIFRFYCGAEILGVVCFLAMALRSAVVVEALGVSTKRDRNGKRCILRVWPAYDVC